MRLKHSHIFAMAIMILLPAGRVVAEETDAKVAPVQRNLSDLREQPIFQVAETAEQFAGTAPADNVWLEFDEVEETKVFGARLGWWGTFNSGSLNMTGEWQGLHPSSPFFDVDGLISNGNRTLDFFVTGPENEATKAGFHFYNGPGLTADIDYDRFLHRLGHEPIPYNPTGPTGFNPTALTQPRTVADWSANLNPTWALYGQDLNVGQDYALNVQTMKANFKGNLTENIKWRLNVWGMEKTGVRQTNAVTHCYTDVNTNNATNTAYGVTSRCHAVSRGQQIDWLTMEIEPVIEARLTDWLTLEYSRTMRSFQQSDQVVQNDYSGNNAFTGNSVYASRTQNLADYALVAENYTAIDRLKLGAQLGCDTDAYVLGYIGDTTNQYRQTNRHFAGADARITNRSLNGVEMTGYGKAYTQDTTEVPYLLDGKNGHPNQYESLASGRVPAEPIDRDFGAVGAKGRWKPFYDDCDTLRKGFALTGGYEYGLINRRPAEDFYKLDRLTAPVGHPDTTSNRYWVGAQQDWTCALNTYLKYTIVDTNNPLYGVTPGQTGTDPVENLADHAINTLLPTHEDRIELGGTWNLADNFMLSGTFFIERTYNHSDYAHFEEDNYPFMVNAWYAPTSKWSVSGGYAQLTNWIQQDINLGNQGMPATPAIATPQVYTSIPASISNQSPWLYSGKADVVNLGTSYAVTECLTVNGGFEYVHGLNAITAIPNGTVLAPAAGVTPTTPYPNNVTGQSVSYSDIPGYSRVEMDSYRLSAGLDYLLRRNVSTFFRYNYYDYRDVSMGYNSGTTSNVLAGLTGTY